MPARRPHRTRLQAERLEDRAVPALFGTVWPEADKITLSFAPDGTKINGASSNLFADLGSSSTASAAWQKDALRAFQAWVAHANINISTVGDTKTDFNAPGPLQGSKNHGDIRIGGRALSRTELATAIPFDLLGAQAGNITVNTAQPLSTNGAAGTYDLYTVLLQEAGHSLGLPNSPDTLSAMFTNYTGKRTGLAVSDIAAIQKLYGARKADRFDAVAPNETAAAATPLMFAANENQFKGTDGTAGPTPFVATGDITTAGDVDTYTVTVPKGSSDFTVELRTGRLSLLTAKVTVTDDKGAVVRSFASTDPRSGNQSLYVGGREGKTYTVKVEANTATPFTVGAYKLAVGKEADKALSQNLPSQYFTDAGTNESVATAWDMGTTGLDPNARWEGTFRAKIDRAGDKDFYKFTTPADATGASVVTVWAAEAGKLDPVLRVYDAAGNRLPAEILGNDASTYTVQVRGVAAKTAYFVEVAAHHPATDILNQGNYFLAVDVRATPVALPVLATGSVNSVAKQQAYTLTSTGARMHYFAVDVAGATFGTAVRLSVYNSSNQVVGTFSTFGGETAGKSVFLTAGTYTIKVAGGHWTGGAFDAAFTVRGVLRDDPIGPAIADTTGDSTGSGAEPQLALGDLGGWGYFDAYSDPWAGI